MWRVRGFSIQGYNHLKEGSPCQDAYRQATVGTSAVLAVADGAGSRSRSAEGAALLVTLSTEILTGLLKTPSGSADARTLEKNLAMAYERIRGEFLRKASLLAGRDRVGDFAATLVAAVLTDAMIGIIQVGDGFAVVRTTGRQGVAYHLLSQPGVTGEYSNETVFVTSEAAVTPEITVADDQGITGVLLSTDGLMPAALRRHSGHQEQVVNDDFARAVLAHLDEDRNDPRLIVRTMLGNDIVGLTGDDLTLLAAVRA